MLLCKYTALEEDRQGLYRFRSEENKGEQYVSFTGNTFGSGTGSDRIFSGQQFRAPDARQQSDGDEGNISFMFTIMLHIGTLLAVVAVFYKDILRLLTELVRMAADLAANLKLRFSGRGQPGRDSLP